MAPSIASTLQSLFSSGATALKKVEGFFSHTEEASSPFQDQDASAYSSSPTSLQQLEKNGFLSHAKPGVPSVWDSETQTLRSPEEMQLFQKQREMDKKLKSLPSLTLEYYNRAGHAGIHPRTELEQEDFEAANQRARNDLGLPPKNWSDRLKENISDFLSPNLDRFGNVEGGPVIDQLQHTALRAEMDHSPIKAATARIALGVANTGNQAITPQNIILAGAGGASPTLGKAILIGSSPLLAQGTYEKGKEALQDFKSQTPTRGLTPLVEGLMQGAVAVGGVREGFKTFKEGEINFFSEKLSTQDSPPPHFSNKAKATQELDPLQRKEAGPSVTKKIEKNEISPYTKDPQINASPDLSEIQRVEETPLQVGDLSKFGRTKFHSVEELEKIGIEGVKINRGVVEYKNPQEEIGWTQDSIGSNFFDGTPVFKMVEELRLKEISPEDVDPIRLIKFKGELFTLDHRRLSAFREAGMTKIRTQMASFEDVVEALRQPKRGKTNKFTSKNNGASIRKRPGR